MPDVFAQMCIAVVLVLSFGNCSVLLAEVHDGRCLRKSLRSCWRLSVGAVDAVGHGFGLGLVLGDIEMQIAPCEREYSEGAALALG